MKLLDLFCGAGGSAVGYHRAGFDEIVGVDIKPQPHYPFRFVLADALTYPLNGFDVIHASPPCQAYSKTNAKCRDRHPRLISIVRNKLQKSQVPYVIENVECAGDRLKNPIKLCGSMFGLPIRRHRLFEIHPLLAVLLPECQHKKNPVYITGTPRPKNGERKDPPAAVKRAAMDTPWMTIKDMDEAIPPAYTFFIGKQFIKANRARPLE